ncbi:MAG TPA: hypothetical protein DCP89_00625 [Acidimicrobiaceae bacterium]|nr:septum formation inhibitor Maf [Actinomycetota bacterium]HAN06977.1 hypothetical protein [Acidimicrobiaceae bacterium]
MFVQPFLTLASSSPRRKALLQSLGIKFCVINPNIDESVSQFESAAAYVKRISVEKAATQTVNNTAVILAADTCVSLQGDILGKPSNKKNASEMLTRLSGKMHEVHTGVTIKSKSRVETLLVTTAVEFVELDQATITWYLETAEFEGKAGAYAIQGLGSTLVRSINGSYTNVVGLPLTETVETLSDFGIRLPGRETP